MTDEIQLRTACDCAPIGIFFTDLEGRWTYANPRCQSLCGFTSERIGQLWTHFVDAEDRDHVRRNWSAAAARRELFEADVRCCTQTDWTPSVCVKISPMLSAEGTSLGYVGIVEERSARRQSEIELAAGEAAYRRLFEISLNAVYALSADAVFVSLTPAFEAMTGWSMSEWIGRPFVDLLHPDDSGVATERFQQLLRGENSRRLELRFRTNSGDYRWAEIVAQPQIHQGKAIGIFGFARDVTRRKRAEERLRVEFIISRILAESATIGEASHRILRAVCDSLRWDRGELWTLDRQVQALRCGETWQTSDRDFPRFDALARQASGAGDEPLVARIRHKGNPAAIADISQLRRYRRGSAAAEEGLRGALAFPIRTEESILAVMIFFSREIRKPDKELLKTFRSIGNQIGLFIERTRAEERLRASERRFDAFMNHSAAVAWIKDQDFRYVFVNRAFEQQRAVPRGSVIGKTDFDLWPLQTAEELRRNDQAVLRSGMILQAYERFPAANGKVHYCRVFRFQFRDAERRFVGGIAMDITERKDAEEALRKLPQQILQAEERERRRVARELHDSVCQLISSARFRLQSVSQDTESDNRIVREDLAKTTDLLVRALREARRISHNLLPSELEDLGLLAAIRSACADLESRTGIHVKLRVSPMTNSLPQEVELTLYRILQEALTNIEKHSGASGVRLALSRERAIIELRIQDDGKGMPRGAPRRRSGKRSGLGLISMRERAAMVGGTFEVRSAPKQGTEIVTRIPVHEITAI